MNRATAQSFYEAQGMPPADTPDHIKGMDLRRPMSVETLPNDTKVTQYQVPGGRQGNYYAPPGTDASELRIAPQDVLRTTGSVMDKVPQTYRTTQDIEVPKPTAAPITDLVGAWNADRHRRWGHAICHDEQGSFRAVTDFASLEEAVAFARAYAQQGLSRYPYYAAYRATLDQTDPISSALARGGSLGELPHGAITLGLMAAKELGNDERDFAHALHITQRYADAAGAGDAPPQ